MYTALQAPYGIPYAVVSSASSVKALDDQLGEVGDPSVDYLIQQDIKEQQLARPEHRKRLPMYAPS